MSVSLLAGGGDPSVRCATTADRAAGRTEPRNRRARDSGQAMAEYAIVVAAVVGLGAYTLLSFLPEFIEALQSYYDSYYIILSLPIP